MPKKITLNAETFAVPLSKLTLSPKNVRKTYDPAEIEEMAASIAVKGRGLIQNLGVTEQVDEHGTPTGLWEVVAGGRRYRGLALLVQRKRLAATASIPCRRVADQDAIDTSLAENEDRKALHPADAYEAFAALHEGGRGVGVEEIAARFGVTVHTVRQRLRLGTVAPVLLAAYREGKLTLDHVMAFTITEDQSAQERAFAELQGWQCTPQAIRRVLTQASVPAHDPRALLVGLDTYQAAGGQVQRDLFTADGGGWLINTPLLERLAGKHVQQVADQLRAEGWKWVVTDPADSHACWRDLRRVWPEDVPVTEADQRRRDELAARFDELALDYPNGDAPDKVQAEFEAIQAELNALEERERAFRPEDMARSGATITLTPMGSLRIERGYIRPEDEPQFEPEPESEEAGDIENGNDEEDENEAAEEAVDEVMRDASSDSTPETVLTEAKALVLPADLDAELSAHRTAALRMEIMRQPDLALRVLAHSFATATFYGGYLPTVARIAHPYGAGYGIGGSGLADSPARQAVRQAEDEQKARLPSDHAELWTWLQAQDVPAIHTLLAVCIGRVADAGGIDWTSANSDQHVAAKAAAKAGLDMRQWWAATRDSYLSRVTKAGILDAVREGAGEDTARRIAEMKKDAMAENAETLLAGKGWLPARLRVPTAAEAEPVLTAETCGGEGDGSEYSVAAE